MSFYSFYAIINYEIQSQETVNLSPLQFIYLGSTKSDGAPSHGLLLYTGLSLANLSNPSL